MALEAIRYKRGSLRLLDQLALPHETKWVAADTAEAAWDAIREMKVRGAPAIAIAAALSLAAELSAVADPDEAFGSARGAASRVAERLAYLVTSRPTAVNLSNAAAALNDAATRAAAEGAASAASVVARYVEAAEAMLEEDVAANRALGEHGAHALLEAALRARGERRRAAGGSPEDESPTFAGEQGGPLEAPPSGGAAEAAVSRDSPRLVVLTHCNTGSLATAGYGTALGVIRRLHETGALRRALATETRPYWQGARLTAYELAHDGVPATLLPDSAAAQAMRSGQVDAVVVGADRVAANGDVANKIGTLALAVAAKRYGVPFFVASPTSTLDPTVPTGADIVIELRDAEELTHVKGERVAAAGVDAWNPGFDVTDAELISGIITERGVIRPGPGGAYDVPAFLQSDAGGPAGPRPMTLDEVRAYVASRPELAAVVLGGAGEVAAPGETGEAAASPADPAAAASALTAREIGDGNINFVFEVRGPAGAVCVKQALPYVRMAGEGWPLGLSRMRHEVAALRAQHEAAPLHVPRVYAHEEDQHLLAMEWIEAPAVVLRHGIVQGGIYPAVATQCAEFSARTHFSTSYVALGQRAFERARTRFDNGDMRRLTQQVIFTDPFYLAKHNRHNAEHAGLGDEVVALRESAGAAAAAALLKSKFMYFPQALLHGDLHTGSLMVTRERMWAIDAEFAFYGPMAFEVGKFVANLLLAAHAVGGLGEPEERDPQREWLIAAAQEYAFEYSRRFAALWVEQAASADESAEVGEAGEAAGTAAREATDEAAEAVSDDEVDPDLDPDSRAFAEQVLGGRARAEVAAAAFLREVERDAVRFAGAVAIRRLVGIAHVAEFENIRDPQERGRRELNALRMGRRLLEEGWRYDTHDHPLQAAVRAEAAQILD